jgi:flagellar protein FliO/FliZ
MSSDLNNLIVYIAAFIFVIALIALAAWLYRSLAGGSSGGGGLFGGRDRRLGVTEAVSMDGRRKLILIRRDDVEHLIMTGGPIDVVLETGISPRRAPEPSLKAEPQNSDRILIAREDQRAVRDPNEKK